MAVTEPAETLDLRGAARRLRVSIRELLELVDSGRLAAHKDAGELRFRVDDLDSFGRAT